MLEILFTDAEKKKQFINDVCKLVADEVAAKSGLSGLAIRAGYNAVKGTKTPEGRREIVGELLPKFIEKIDPIWQEAKKYSDRSADYLGSKRSEVADALLSVTDTSLANDPKMRYSSTASSFASNMVIRSTYEKLRGSAKKNVEGAVPAIAKLIEKYESQ